MLLTKLAVSVAYNFLGLTGVDNCAFFVVMGPLDQVAWMGASFDRFVFPTCLFLMVFLTAFGVYGRILNCLGLKQYQFDVDYAEEKVIEGKYTIDLYKEQVLKLTPYDLNKEQQNINVVIEEVSSHHSTETTPNALETKEIVLDDLEEKLLSPQNKSFEEVTGIN